MSRLNGGDAWTPGREVELRRQFASASGHELPESAEHDLRLPGYLTPSKQTLEEVRKLKKAGVAALPKDHYNKMVGIFGKMPHQPPPKAPCSSSNPTSNRRPRPDSKNAQTSAPLFPRLPA